jgi:hypothetical protein
VPLDEFVGYLGFTSQGVVAIHADWPAYPAEHGAGMALASFGSFPGGTRFQPISDIDRCLLFYVHGYGQHKDLFSEEAFHVAAWHEDLLVLQEHDLVEGVEPLTERMWEERRRQEWRDDLRREAAKQGHTFDDDPLLSVGWEGEDGQWHRARWDSLDDYDEEAFTWAAVNRTRGLRVTERGWAKLNSILADALVLPDSVRPRVQLLLDAEMYDTAVRELGVTIEWRLRQALGLTSEWLPGPKLVEAFIGRLRDPARYVQAYVKVLRGNLRTAFKFIRNEFAHRRIDLPKARAYALVARLAAVLADIEAIDLSAGGEGQPPLGRPEAHPTAIVMATSMARTTSSTSGLRGLRRSGARLTATTAA